MIDASLNELSRALAAKRVSSVELTGLFLDRIERLNPALNAFVTVEAEKAWIPPGPPMPALPAVAPAR